MTKREQCYQIFTDNQGAIREHAIFLAMKEAGVTKTTAQTYYPIWRKELMNKPGYVAPAKDGMQENVKNSTETANEIIKVDEILPTKAIIKQTKGTETQGIPWKADVINLVETIKVMETEKEDILEVTKLIPVVMLGKYGRYTFDNDGVKAYPFEEFINKEIVEEAREAVDVWETCYGKEGGKAC
ncbi:hypothetical protein [Clostridium lacusfryxellense]|uniref:hypothetical protein n=1 Tax=Clostridium lacusfryxellense TaxID=205328 RepID=UPI001C0E4A09|nr:hypothetical protein [Clostridium lacusfryxellense]MBU3111969.1 hypothetical protein [Clostridium lacusfryxellense]